MNDRSRWKDGNSVETLSVDLSTRLGSGVDMLMIQTPGKEKEKNGCNKIALQK
jgi:hypothetical protein